MGVDEEEDELTGDVELHRLRGRDSRSRWVDLAKFHHRRPLEVLAAEDVTCL
jgi:hypothetical protein